MLGFDNACVTTLTILAALLHEVGHVSIYFMLKGKIRLPYVTADGFRIMKGDRLSYTDEALIALGGPLVNLTIFFILFRCEMAYLKIFAIINLFTAISNLLPLYGYDGYRIINSLVCRRYSPLGAERLLLGLGLAVSCALTFLSLFFILISGSGYWIFGIFFASLLGNIFKYHKADKCEILRDFERF